MSRRPPRKSRVWVAPRIGGYQAKPSADPKPEPPPKSATPPEAYSAPGHMGGQFEEAGYHSGAGIFGFTQR